METIKINGKTRPLKATFSGLRSLINKYKDRGKLTEWDENKILKFTLDVTWEFLKPNMFGIKPYGFRFIFGKMADFNDIRNSLSTLMKLLAGDDDDEGEDEDKEQKNEMKG